MADVTVQGPKCNEISDYNTKLIHNICLSHKVMMMRWHFTMMCGLFKQVNHVGIDRPTSPHIRRLFLVFKKGYLLTGCSFLIKQTHGARKRNNLY